MRYSAFGLSISSDLALPPLVPLNSADESSLAQFDVEKFGLSGCDASTGIGSDVCITYREVSKLGLHSPAIIRPRSQSADNELWFHAPGIAYFHVFNGNTVYYEPDINNSLGQADEQSIRLYLLGTCMGAILHQRNHLVLHANAIKFGNECVLFAGLSGSGKSTLAAAFYQRGYELLSDDLAAIDSHGLVLPAYPQIKLWHDTLEKLGVDADPLSRIRQQVDKYAYPLTERFCSSALPVKAIYILTTHNQDTIKFDPIHGIEKFTPLKNQTYRVRHLEGFGLKSQHMKLCASLANKVKVTRITRPKNGCSLEDMVALIEDDLKASEAIA